jgi:hypothetical protein
MAEWGTYVSKPIRQQISETEQINDPKAVYEIVINYVTIIPDTWLQSVLEYIAMALETFTVVDVLYIRATSSHAVIQVRPKSYGLSTNDTATLNPMVMVGGLILAIVAVLMSLAIVVGAVAAYKLVDQEAPAVSTSLVLIAVGVAAVGVALLAGEVQGKGYTRKAKAVYTAAKRGYNTVRG